MIGNLKPNQTHIKKALGSIADPYGKTDLVTGGYVSAVTIEKGAVTVILSIDPRDAQAFEAVRQQAEQAVLAVKRVKRATVILTAEHMPDAADSVRAGAATSSSSAPSYSAKKEYRGVEQGEDAPSTTIALPNVQYVVAVASGKGGVGKSTVAANLAAAMTRMGMRVGLLDADIYGPSQPIMFGAADEGAQTDGAKILPVMREGIALMSSGFLVAGRTPLVWRGPMVHKALIQMIRDVAWGTLDVLVIDMPPGTGDVALTLAKYAPFTGAVVVSTPQDIALADARRGIEMFAKLNIPVLGLVENMSQFCCPNCGHATDIFGSGGIDREAEETGVPVIGRLTLYRETRQCADEGKPIVLAQPHHDASAEYLGLADAVMARLKHAKAAASESSGLDSSRDAAQR